MEHENVDTFEISTTPTMPSLSPAIPAGLSQSLTADESGDENADPFEVSTMLMMPSPLPAMPTEPSTTTCEFIE
jgi:hypothetical protein